MFRSHFSYRVLYMYIIHVYHKTVNQILSCEIIVLDHKLSKYNFIK